MKRTISLLLAVLMCCGLLFSVSQPTVKAQDAPNSPQKISVFLLKDIVNKTDDELVTVGVFMNGPTDAEIEAMIPLPKPSLTNWSQAESDAYYAVKRSLKREVFSAAEKAFVEHYLDDSAETILHDVESEPAPCFWLVLPKGRIAELAALDAVRWIGNPSESEPLTKLSSDDSAAQKKIAEPLRDYLENMPENERIPIRLWLRGDSGEEVRNLIPVDYPDLTSSEAEIRAYLSAREETIRACRNNRVRYFVQNRLDEEDEILYQGAKTQSLVVVVPKAKIAALTALRIVSQIDPAFGYDEEFPDPEFPEDPDEYNKIDESVREVMTIAEHDERIPVSLQLQTLQNPVTGECVETVLDETDEIVGRFTDLNVIQVLVPKYKIAALSALGEVASIGWAIDYDAPVYPANGAQKSDVQPLTKDPAVYEKVSPYLLGYMENLPDDAGIPIGIIFKGPSEEEVEALIAETYSGEENTAAYHTAKNRAQHKLNSAITSAFVEEYLDENDTLYYQGHILCVTAMVPKSKIMTIAALDEVTHIDLVSENDAPLEPTNGNGTAGYEQPCAHDYLAEVTIPTCTEPGFTTYTCAMCGDSYVGNEVSALEHDYADGICTRCGAEDPDYVPPVADPFRFDDVKNEKAFFFKPVYWAVEKKITKGTGDTAFSPDEGCTRAQVVTFLWRAAGEPEPQKTENPFKDVKEGAYYCKAVAWAVEQGITKGMTDTTFAPYDICTRGQIVTFLYRSEGTPEIAKKSKLFHDVADGQYYADAVAWAVENKITRGKSADVFSPDATCTRGEVVTFLFRAMGGK